jgi:putative glutamine amidotransferase
VSLDGSTRLGVTLGRRRIKVNSFHHQGVARLGEGLAVVGRASDGTVESIEATDRECVLGVQWHAECLVDRSEQAALFAALVTSARGLRAGATHLRVA